jgi:hypothetical protein
MSGTIFAVNDISGIPSIEVDDTGVVRIAQYTGNVLVGTSTDNSIGKLQVNGYITSANGYYAGSQQVIDSTGQWVGLTISSTAFTVASDTTTNSSFYPVFVSGIGSNQTPTIASSKLYFNPSTGRMSATQFNSLSDIAFKENIQDINNSSEIVDALNPVQFSWKDTKEISYGFIAQDLEKTMPELVNENNGIKSVSYIPLIAILIKEVKRLKLIIDNK